MELREGILNLTDESSTGGSFHFVFRILFDEVIEQEWLVSHYALEACLMSSHNGLLGVADPSHCYQSSSFEMPQQGTTDKVGKFKDIHGYFYLPVIFRLSPLQIPVQKLLRVNWDLQRNPFLQPHEGNQPQQVGGEHFVD